MKILLSSRFWLHFYGWQALIWVITFPLAVLLWADSVLYLIVLSQVTALTGALGGLATVLSERKAEPLLPEIDPEVDKLSD